jgi:adenylate kinase family enzyme
MLIILTGPPGAGKSTIAKLLANKFSRSVHFSTDTIRHFIVGGNCAPWDTSNEAKKQHKLSEEIAQLIISKFIQNKYVVILDGIYQDKDFIKFRKKYSKVLGFTLLPEIQVNYRRDKMRDKAEQMPQRVKVLHKYFSSNPLKHYQLVDSTNHKPQQTLRLIYSQIPKQF